MKIISVVGARPNFMKIAPFIRSIEAYNITNNNKIDHLLVHTGQHYDDQMSLIFFKQLSIPNADINLEVGSGSHAQQVGQTMMKIEKVIIDQKPDWIVVVGDVNATIACSITAKKEGIRLCHIEAGLRSGDLSMPEEINRLVTDRLADLLLTPDKLAIKNLIREGVSENRIAFVGNIMIDTLDNNIENARKLTIPDIVARNVLDGHPINSMSFDENNFAIITLHRPANVDNKTILNSLIDFLVEKVSNDLTLLWPVHPRTKKQLLKFGLFQKLLNNTRIILLKPISYHEMLRLNMSARIMLTDSGGLQEECTVLGTPCLTLRWNTERPITLRDHGGINVLVGNNIQKIKTEYYLALEKKRTPIRPPLWDGKTSDRCLMAILNYMNT